MQIAKLLLCLFVISMIGEAIESSMTPFVGAQWAKISYLVTIIGTIYATKKIMF